MISLLVIFICLVELSTAHVIDLTVYQTLILWQIEIVIVAAIALVSEPTQRDKSILTIILLWFAWVAASDWLIPYAYPLLVQYDSAIFSFSVLWALTRSYFYTSADISIRNENVIIGFYQGTHSPLISSLGALIGFPFSSMVIVAGETVLRSSGCGHMTLNNRAILQPKDYVFIDTGVEADEETFKIIAGCVGKPTKSFGIFRTKCIRNCEPVLALVGLKPKSWWHCIPSIFYYQVVRGNRG